MATATAARAVKRFAELKDTHEHPIGSNHVPGITDFLHTASGATTGNGPWCCMTVSRVLHDVGIHDFCDPKAFGGWVNGCAYVPYVTRKFRGTKQWITKGHERAGDIPIFVWGGPGSNPEGDHIGMCYAPGKVATEFSWEGNSSGPDGYDEVAQHERAYEFVLGFVRPTYGKPQKAAEPRPAPPVAHPTVKGEPHYGGALFLTSPHLLANHDVRQWQNRMAKRGYDIDIDGVYGEQSETVCRKFQRDCNAHKWPVGAVDGIVGPNTWHASWARPL